MPDERDCPLNRSPYSVTFDPNGGSVSPTPTSATTDLNGKLSSLPTPTRSGYSFAGWYTEKTGGASVLSNFVFNGNTTIFAHWFKEVDACAVTVTPPMAGSHPATTGKTDDPSRYKVTDVAFHPLNGDGTEGAALSASDTFASGKIYRVWVRLTGTGGFTEDTPVTVNGIAANSYGALTGRGIYYVDMQCENPFVDVQESDFFFNPVMWAVGQTVASGIDETHFAPDRTVMRCDSMVFFCAAKGRPAHADIQSPFVDVQPKHWYYDAVMWAVEDKITGGTDTTHFSPKRTCSRSEILQFLYAAMGKPGYTIENPYSDVKPKHWYYDGAIWAYQFGLEKNEVGKFQAKTPCTRGYVVTYLYRFITGKELAE